MISFFNINKVLNMASEKETEDKNISRRNFLKKLAATAVFTVPTIQSNHPALLRFCLRAGKLLSEDSSIEGSGSPSGGGRSAAEVLFGDLGLRR